MTNLDPTDSSPAKRAAELAEHRARIDRLDDEIIALIARRQREVEGVGRVKAEQALADPSTAETVEAPDRFAAVIRSVRRRAEAAGASPDVVEAAYRAMIGAFIELEHGVHRDATTRD